MDSKRMNVTVESGEWSNGLCDCFSGGVCTVFLDQPGYNQVANMIQV